MDERSMYIVHFGNPADDEGAEYVCYRCVYPFIGKHLDSIHTVSILAEPPEDECCAKCGYHRG
jgi:hypothetical protein